MKPVLLLFFAFFTLGSQAAVISPSAVEVKFSYSGQFHTRKGGDAEALVLEQAKYLFGYMQNPEIGASFGLGPEVTGVAAPRWAPEFKVTRDTTVAGRRTIDYDLHGILLMDKRVAKILLAKGEWTIELPFSLDHFYSKDCADPDNSDRSEFWYFYDPFRAGCERFRSLPLAASVTLRIEPAPPVSANLGLKLADLRGDNGNGNLFQITSINGFDEASTKRRDLGRVNFQAMNAWIRDQGFRETSIDRYREHPIRQFEKTVKKRNGEEVVIRLTRLLADTDLDGSRDPFFARFLEAAIQTSDVIVYEGHSGLGVNLSLPEIEKRAGGKIEFNRDKRQVFFFDSCSSYSYYLGMFAGKKTPGTLAVISNGLESSFDSEIPITQSFYRSLFDMDDDRLNWHQLLTRMESPLNGRTFLLNVDLNLEDSEALGRITSPRW